MTTVQSNSQLKSYFEQGDFPNETQFAALIDRISYGDYVNVIDYGVSAANPNNAVAIKAAISASLGRTLYFPGSGGSGETYLTGPVSANRPYTIVGDGIGKTIIKLKNSADSDLFISNNTNGIVVRDVTLDGNRAFNSRVSESGNAFQFDTCNYINLSNIQIQNFAYIGTRFSNCSDVTVYGSKIKNSFGGWYFAAGAGSPSKRVRITDCVVSGSSTATTGGDQFSFDNTNLDCSWNNCISINSFADGFIVFGNTAAACERISIDNCKVYNAGSNGMSLHSCNDVTITNPIINGTGVMGHSSAAATGFGNGIDISNNEANQTEINRITITGGTLKNINKHGIRLLDTQTTEIKNVNIEGTVILDVGTVSGGTNTFDGVNIKDCEDISIRGLRIAAGGSTGRDGIRVGASALRTFISDNNILAGGGAEITNQSTSTVIFHQKNTGAAMMGVTAPATSYTANGSLTLPVSAVVRSWNTTKFLAHVFNNSGTPVSGGNCFNVAGFTDNGVGNWTITTTTSIATDANDVIPFVIAESTGGTKKLACEIIGRTTKSIQVFVYDSSGGVATDPDRLYAGAYGID